MLGTLIAPPAVNAAAPAPQVQHGAPAAPAASDAPDDSFARQLDKATQDKSSETEQAGEAATTLTPASANPARAKARTANEAKPADKPAAKRVAGADTVEMAPTARDRAAPAAPDGAPPADLTSLLAGLLGHHKPAPTPASDGASRAADEAKAAGAVAADTAGPAGAQAAAAPQPASRPEGELPAFALPAAAANPPAPAVAEAPPPAPPVRESQIAVPVGSPAFASGLGAEVSLMLRDGVQEARLQLNPAEMGPITVQIQVEGGNAQVTMSAEQAPTRDALEQALPTLAAALQDNGLTLTGGGVFEQPRPPRDDGPAAPGPWRSGESGRDAAAVALAPPRATPRGVVDLYA